ncbi:lipid kinase YegS [Halomonas cibimaris]|uniref:lipid kinase YegS n=1 Tax=Halomonas cibimaris TaxID=657012 RepID=UPI0031D5CA22
MSDINRRYVLVVNGKSAGDPALRAAVAKKRRAGMALIVYATWEAGDAGLFAEASVDHGATHVIAGGGDGTVNEVVNGLMRLPREKRPALGIVPLGSANDFARSLGLPLEPYAALQKICRWDTQPVDVVRISAAGRGKGVDQYYLNMATGGFGAEVTSSTPKLLKKLLGGAAYSVMGAFKTWRHRSYEGTLNWDTCEEKAAFLLVALGNARQSGGGQVLAPRAKINDGYLDMLLVKNFTSFQDLPQLIRELRQFPARGRFVRYLPVSKLSVSTDPSHPAWPLTLDGEAHRFDAFSAEVVPLALRLAMPEDSSLLVARTPASLADNDDGDDRPQKPMPDTQTDASLDHSAADTQRDPSSLFAR